jgi:hypothetical protein
MRQPLAVVLRILFSGDKTMFSIGNPFPNDVYTPSATVFDGSPGPLLNPLGSGWHILAQGINLPSTVNGLSLYAAAGAAIGLSSIRDSAWVGSTASGTGTSTVAGQQMSLFTRPIVRLDSGSAEVYLETSVAFSSTGADTATQGYFFGLSKGTGSTVFQAAGALTSTVSAIGFLMSGSTSDTFQAVFIDASASGTSTASTISSNLMAVNPGVQDALGNTLTSAPGNLASDAFHKLGLRIRNGHVYFYVDGYHVASRDLDKDIDVSSTAYRVVQASISQLSTEVLRTHNEFLRIDIVK